MPGLAWGGGAGGRCGVPAPTILTLRFRLPAAWASSSPPRGKRCHPPFPVPTGDPMSPAVPVAGAGRGRAGGFCAGRAVSPGTCVDLVTCFERRLCHSRPSLRDHGRVNCGLSPIFPFGVMSMMALGDRKRGLRLQGSAEGVAGTSVLPSVLLSFPAVPPRVPRSRGEGVKGLRRGVTACWAGEGASILC